VIHFAGDARRLVPQALPAVLVAAVLLTMACKRPSAPTPREVPPSAVSVKMERGSIVITTPAAEFAVLPSGYVRAVLLAGGNRLTLDDPVSKREVSNERILVDGKEIRDFVLDLAHAKVSDSSGLLGARGRKLEISGRSKASPVEETLAVEVYDDFPNLALMRLSLKNVGSGELRLGQVTTQQHRLNAALAEPAAPPYRLWSFQGTSYEWGRDSVRRISRNFSQPNAMGAISPSGAGGGIPVVAFWTASVGVALGHVEALPLVLSLPVKVERDQRIGVSLDLDAQATLRPGEVYSTPRSFVAVYAGDFYEPLALYARVLQRKGRTIPKPNGADYEANWCGWGYRSDVTPAQMLGTIPKLKELNINWATLDYRWFENFGEWEPRRDTFPGVAIKKLVDEFHQQGIRVQLWWLPLAAGDGREWEAIGPEETTPAARLQQRKVAQVVREHPDWLILDRSGKHARLFLNRAALCPALPEVREYYGKLTEKFIGEWGFDGHKLDMCFTVPACYNARHHHRSPEDSIRAMGEVFRVIFESTRRLKPESVTQICPCGTVPNVAWLPYMDQAVTADPVGAVQVRQRIKMYKALLGPQAAVYGDHVELSGMRRAGRGYVEVGKDFASTLGLGGVVGTKFTWPNYGSKFKRVYLDSEKEALWKKWIALYNAKMLSRGTFQNLYVYGYDVPEGYAIEQDGKMYYAFFAPAPSKAWKGEVELRGLEAGKYRVYDYENGRDLGTIDGQNPRLATEFGQHLLLEVSKL